MKGQRKLKFCWDCAYNIPLLLSLKNFLSSNEILEEVTYMVVIVSCFIEANDILIACSSNSFVLRSSNMFEYVVFVTICDVAISCSYKKCFSDQTHL